MQTTRLIPALILLAAAPLAASAQALAGGRQVNGEKDFSITAHGGKVFDIQGSVKETTRTYYALVGRDADQADAENYSLDELGLTESEMTYGLALEKMGKYFTFRLNLSTLSVEADSVADRDYFIGVDDIEFQGNSYEYMKLEDGTAYDASLDGFMGSLALQWTPFTIAPENIISFTPWLHLGVQFVAGSFEVDAGPAERIQLYENPPREYVVGGKGEGDSGIFAPEIGGGGELKIYLGQTENGVIDLAVQGTYAVFEYSGSSSSLGISSRNDKDLDLDYEMLELRLILSYPLSKTMDFIFGAEYRQITADASSKAKFRDREDALTRREKFDKDINLELTHAGVFAGFRW